MIKTPYFCYSSIFFKHFLQIFWHVSVDVRNGLKHDLLYLPLYKHLGCSKKKNHPIME